MIPNQPKSPSVFVITRRAVAHAVAAVASEGPDVDPERIAKMFDPFPKRRHIQRVRRLMLPPVTETKEQ